MLNGLAGRYQIGLTAVESHDGVSRIVIGSVNGRPVSPTNVDARDLAQELAALDPSARPSEVGTPWRIRGEGFFTEPALRNRIEVAFREDDLPARPRRVQAAPSRRPRRRRRSPPPRRAGAAAAADAAASLPANDAQLAAQLDAWMARKNPGAPLQGYGAVFVREGKANGVDPRLLVAIARAETSLGLRPRRDRHQERVRLGGQPPLPDLGGQHRHRREGPAHGLHRRRPRHDRRDPEALLPGRRRERPDRAQRQLAPQRPAALRGARGEPGRVRRPRAVRRARSLRDPVPVAAPVPPVAASPAVVVRPAVAAVPPAEPAAPRSEGRASAVFGAPSATRARSPAPTPPGCCRRHPTPPSRPCSRPCRPAAQASPAPGPGALADPLRPAPAGGAPDRRDRQGRARRAGWRRPSGIQRRARASPSTAPPPRAPGSGPGAPTSPPGWPPRRASRSAPTARASATCRPSRTGRSRPTATSPTARARPRSATWWCSTGRATGCSTTSASSAPSNPTDRSRRSRATPATRSPPAATAPTATPASCASPPPASRPSRCPPSPPRRGRPSLPPPAVAVPPAVAPVVPATARRAGGAAQRGPGQRRLRGGGAATRARSPSPNTARVLPATPDPAPASRPARRPAAPAAGRPAARRRRPRRPRRPARGRPRRAGRPASSRSPRPSSTRGVVETSTNDAPRIAEYRTATEGAGVGPWCAYFTSWVAAKAGVPVGPDGSGIGYVPTLKNWAEQTDRYIPNGEGPPQVGDLVVFDWQGDGVLDHVGIVSAVKPDGSIETIEGNAGDKIAARSYGPDGYAGLVRLAAPGEQAVAMPAVPPPPPGPRRRSDPAAASPAVAARPRPPRSRPPSRPRRRARAAPAPSSGRGAARRRGQDRPPQHRPGAARHTRPRPGPAGPPAPNAARPRRPPRPVPPAADLDPAAVAGAAGPYPGDGAPKEQVAAWMARMAQAAGLPPELPVMAALVESGLSNLDHGDADSLGFFQMRVSVWNRDEYAGYPDSPELQMKWFIDQATRDQAQAPGGGALELRHGPVRLRGVDRRRGAARRAVPRALPGAARAGAGAAARRRCAEVRGALAGAACLLVLAATAGTAAATPPGINGLIAFEEPAGSGEIVTMTATGANQTPLTSTPEQNSDAAWSPDGTQDRLHEPPGRGRRGDLHHERGRLEPGPLHDALGDRRAAHLVARRHAHRLGRPTAVRQPRHRARPTSTAATSGSTPPTGRSSTPSPSTRRTAR